jgi:HSP20 family protein
MMRLDPLREIDRLTQPMWKARAAAPLDVYRKGEKFVVRVDLPGIDPQLGSDRREECAHHQG